MKTTKKRIGYSLSGGGARAAAHIGILQALRENGIEADCIAGTSGGAIIGTLYAAGMSAEDMLKFAERGSGLKIYKPGLPIGGITNLDYLKGLLEEHIGNDSFENLNIPLAVVATNLMTGEKEVFETGELYRAIMASCSIPLVFKPVEIDGSLYADGGIVDNMPVSPLLPQSDILIGMHVTPTASMTTGLKSMYSIGIRVFDINVAHNSQINFPVCDIVIEPKRVTEYSIFNYGASRELYQLGYEAAQEKIPEILELLERLEEQKDWVYEEE